MNNRLLVTFYSIVCPFVAVELCKGPIFYALQKYDFVTRFHINPAMLARYRIAFSPSGAKDDPTDAELALDIMLRYPEKLNPYTKSSWRLNHLILPFMSFLTV
jgi:hypothetical protein